MKIKASLCLVFATLSFLILFSTSASADVAQGTETQITTNESPQYNPDIYGNRIVWEDARNGNRDIYMYDLSTSTETQITTNTSDQESPAIYEDKIVWVDRRNGNDNPDIYMYDLSTSTETQITINTSTQISPAIFRDKVVWADDRNGNRDIYMYDLSTSTETQITTNESAQDNPDIYGNKIVWEDARNGNRDIYMYDLSTSTETQITTSEGASFPAIHENRIVWVNNSEGKGDIYMYDLSNSTETKISSKTPGLNSNTKIYENRIVWGYLHDPEADTVVYMHDLSTSKETQITANESGQEDPAIYGNRIVWTDKRNGNLDIYMLTLLEPILPVANFTSNVTEGYAPLTVQFTNLSENTTSLSWDFGDGNISIEENPIHTYYAVGTYTVNLTASNENGTNSKLVEIKVKEVSKKPVANFSASPTSGNVPLTVDFTDRSTGVPTSWKWSFGDGKSSTEKNPQHVYSKAGKYTVSLTVKNSFGKNTATRLNYITVVDPNALNANFTATPLSGIAPLTVSFTDTSTGSPKTWFWNFGDGKFSPQQNPTHTYKKAGKYTVILTVTSGRNMDKETKLKYITVSKT